MSVPAPVDVLIRVHHNTLPTSYMVARADTDETLAGPFWSMGEAAIAAAKYVGQMGRIWSQPLDHHGHPRGRAQRLPALRPSDRRISAVTARVPCGTWTRPFLSRVKP